MRTSKRALLGLALATALVPITATTAQAGGTSPTYSQWNPGNCLAGHLCVYKDTNYGQGGAGIAMFQYDNPVWSDTRNAYIAQEDSSWFNNGTGTSFSSVMVYSDYGYTGNAFCLDKGWGNTWDRVANDQGESNRWVNGC